MRLLLDEMIGPQVAVALRRSGLDVEAVVESIELRGRSDAEILAYAQEADRVVVTRNASDFVRLHGDWSAQGRRHPGLVIVTERAFPQTRNLVGALVTALLAAHRGATLPPDGGLLYLPAT